VLPPKLLKLTISLGDWECMPALPPKLIYLKIFKSYGLKSLSGLPDTLITLVLLACPELASVSEMPSKLETVSIEYCYLLGNKGFKVGATNIVVVVPDRRHLPSDNC
jgi:hypothetical protein